jgi:hypothetical protein
MSFSELQLSSLGSFVFQWITVKFLGVLCLSVNYIEVPWGPLSFSELQWSSLGSLCLSVNYTEVPWGPLSFSLLQWSFLGFLCLSVNYSEVPWGPYAFQWITAKFPKVSVYLIELKWIFLKSLCLSVNYSEVSWGPLSFSELQWSFLGSFVFQWITMKFPGFLCLSVYYGAIPWSSCVHAGTYVCGQQGMPHRWGHTASCRYLKWHKQQACRVTALAYVCRFVGTLIP